MSLVRTGDSDAITREYFDSLLLEMRHLDAVVPSTKFTLFNEEFDTPIMMAALSHLNNIHPNGLAEQADGAKMANAVNWAGMGEKEELERITATGAKTIKIIKPYADSDQIFDKMEHARACGVLAVGMDIDHAFNGSGKADCVLGYQMEPKTTAQLREYIKAAKVPFVVKGVLSEKDADKCLEAGAAAIVVSHHHGIMDYAVPPLMLLPKIKKIIKGQIPIFVDCGFMSGMDVFKALALGADAVSVGRAIMGPLKDQGAKGVCDLINRMTAELAGIMAKTGTATLKDVDSSIIVKKGGWL